MPDWKDELDQPAAELPRDPEAQDIEQIPVTSAPDGEEEEALTADENTADENNGGEEKEKKKFSLCALILEYVELFVTCLGAVLIVFSMIFRICTVSGDSMLPTLKSGELLLVSNLFYEPQSGDIIIFHQTSEKYERFNEPLVKRVVATEGQHVYVDFTDGIVRVDGVELIEDYIQLVNSFGYNIGEYTLFAEHNFRMVPFADGTTHRIFEATVPDGSLFVMGDNRNNSADSRDTAIGFVDGRRILGRVLFRIDKGIRFKPVG